MDIPVPEHFEIEQVQDLLHGRPAKWLVKKMTAADEERIIGLAFDTLDGAGLAERNYEDRYEHLQNNI